jgi:hypothetical protein
LRRLECGRIKEDAMKTTVNKIVPHEDKPLEVHVEFRDDHDPTAPVVNVVVFIEKHDHPLSQVRRLAIDKAFEFIAQITRSEAKAHGL